MPHPLSTDEIRRRFVEFFKSKGHKHVPADSLVPANDKSVLFTGAGMNQFKDHFLGRAKIEHPQQRAVTVQPCVRTSDIENVGRTPNHHACFEMLGNFSFGDYFKEEAIQWSTEFCLDPAVGLGLDEERISVTVYGGNKELGIQKDEEAIAAWKKHAPWLQDTRSPGGWRIYEYGDQDNFWPADAPKFGPNGPCGPCSELYYDTKPEQGSPEPVADSRDKDRYCEFWNLVFTQYNRVGVGALEPLKNKNIDTGSGLERVARLLQGKPNNYEIDLLFPVVQTLSKLCGKEYGKDFEQDRRMRRITDHVRFAVFAIADGVKPDRKGREYVLRRLVRRAVLDGKELGIEQPFMSAITKHVMRQMSAGYSELTKRQEIVVRVIEEEERAFQATLGKGRSKFRLEIESTLYTLITAKVDDQIAKALPGFKNSILSGGFEIIYQDGECIGKMESTGASNSWTEQNEKFGSMKAQLETEWQQMGERLRKAKVQPIFSGKAAFLLWDTHGFPIELTRELADEKHFCVDMPEYEAELEKARLRSRGTVDPIEIFASGPVQELKAKYADKPTVFEGYGQTVFDGAKVLSLVHDGKIIERAEAGQALVLLDRTPFYAESGGQVSDTGRLTSGGNEHRVTGMKKDGGLFLHTVELRGLLKVGDPVSCIVDDEGHRRPTQRNHSATHLLHLALRRMLGTHVEQRGSLVAPDRLRFDFTHFEAIKGEQLTLIENFVNHLVRSNLPVETAEKPIAEARALGAMALFGEKYGDMVRVVTMGNSVELCGGTHVSRTGEMGYFRIVHEGSVSSGIRRIEALTGQGAIEHARRIDETLATASAVLKATPESLLERLKAMQDEKAALERELHAFKTKAAHSAAGDLLAQTKDLNGAKFIAAALDGLDATALRSTLDGLRKQFPAGAVVLAGNKDGKVALLVSLSPELVKRGGHAGNILKEIAPLVGGRGGGNPELAQGGGQDFAQAAEALKKAEDLLVKMLKM